MPSIWYLPKANGFILGPHSPVSDAVLKPAGWGKWGLGEGELSLIFEQYSGLTVWWL